MYVKMKKTTLTVFSVLAALTVAGLCAGLIAMDVTRKNQRSQYESEVAAGWRQSVSELAGALSDLEIDLQKGLYASGNYQTVSWAAQVFSEAGSARTALESLPIYELRLQGTETFLNQVGEYTLEMARKQLRGEELTDSEESTLKTLALRSRQLADEVLMLSERIADENPGYEEMQQLLLPSEEGEEKTEFESLEDIFSGDKPLTYDGQHSAWRESRTSEWLKSLKEVDKAQLKILGAKYLSVKQEDLTEESRFDAPFAFREYRNGDTSVAVTEGGGMLYGFNKLREVTESKLSVEDVLTVGSEALAEFGYEHMEPVSWAAAENTLTVVYAFRQEGVLVYSDRITVTMALDNGEILTLNAMEYLLAHNPDRDLSTTVNKDEALQVLRSDLTVESTDLVSVPGGDGSEEICWQFTVHDETEAKVLIFVNANTKVEEEILILVEDDDRRTAI
ncbi:MAG: germination protein YpeB [Clostridia bacterium]|nr:germination protein YpeB [Clostridia bacterium]